MLSCGYTQALTGILGGLSSKVFTAKRATPITITLVERGVCSSQCVSFFPLLISFSSVFIPFDTTR